MVYLTIPMLHPGNLVPITSSDPKNDLHGAPAADAKGRVLRFRPRNSILPGRTPPPSPVEDLGKYERSSEPDDFRHRMMMNALALAATVVLILVGIWIADTMARMRKNQDCVLIGRPNCAPIEVPPR